MWLWFSLTLGSLPIIFAGLAYFLVGTQAHPIRHGDLYLVSATLSFAGVGSMFQSGAKTKRLTFLMVGGGTALVGVIDALLYAVVSANAHPHSLAVNLTSAILFLVSALVVLAAH